MALHDDLTALPNRVLFGDRVEQGIRAAARMSEPLALLTLDLNGFKHVNDMLDISVGICFCGWWPSASSAACETATR